MSATAESARFYADLSSFSEFERFAEFDAYRPLPEDWVVMAGDVRGSTAAIAAGHYRAVNMVGAAVITGVLNACRGLDLPFVFGGDGGLVAVPGAWSSAAAAALRRVQAHSGRVFGLELRAAAVPVARLRAEGEEISVRRLRLNASNHLAMFAGGGVARVERILKGAATDRAILRPRPDEPPPDLEGLTCRWRPLASSRGSMIALMVRPVDRAFEGKIDGPADGQAGDEEAAGYAAIVERLTAILQSIPAHAPASDRTLRLRWPPRDLWAEAKAARGGTLRAFARAAATSLVQKWCHWRGARVGAYDAPRYLDELKAQTDFRKFDGCLRVVLDCSAEQVAAIEAWLGAEHRAGRLIYGLHEDRAALMTCLVFSLERSEHLHFVDAAGGGFATAAEAFKRREQALRA
jgi:hypothetical protein